MGFLFTFSFLTLFVLRKIASRIGLVDKPTQRKTHSGEIPLVGGITICISMLVFLLIEPDAIPHSALFAICITILTVVGAIDDKYDISFKARLLIQALLSVAMMVFGDIKLVNLGNIFGAGEMITLGWASYIVTIFAVVGAINAFNMVDGIDGLLGGLSLVTFGALSFILFNTGLNEIAYFCLTMIIITLPYIMFNLGILGRKRKVFMGDAGSMVIGFTVVWLLLFSSQNASRPPLAPVNALWLIAIPLIDMAAIMIRRIKKGQSPFKPDREHLHHIFQRLGLSSRQTLFAICFIAACLAGFGIIGDMNNVPENIMFYAFITCFFVYLTLISNIWRIVSLLRSRNRDAGHFSQAQEDSPF